MHNCVVSSYMIAKIIFKVWFDYHVRYDYLLSWFLKVDIITPYTIKETCLIIFIQGFAPLSGTNRNPIPLKNYVL